MQKNKKAQWMWLVYAAIAIGILVVTWIIVGGSLGKSKENINIFQSCDGQKGQCKQSCADNEISQYKALGCGSGEYKDKDYCCLPEKT